MIEFKTGDILKEEVEAIVNTVNCVGVMGRGIALQFKKAYPENFKLYQAACKKQQVVPGQMFVVQVSHLTNPKYIINFPTKRHWKGQSRIEDIELGLQSLSREIRERSIRSIAVPPLGCGLGGLRWSDVRPRIVEALETIPNVQISVFEPSGAPVAEEMKRAPKVPAMTAGRAVLISLIDRYLRGLLDPFVTLLEVHKLMYFMQESGEELKLNYAKALYGPYSTNLGHVLNYVEGYYLSGYADGGDAPDKEIKIIPGAIKDAQAFLTGQPETVARFDKVVDLVSGFETPFGMELLATVHWVVKHEGKMELPEVKSAVYQWNSRKQQFSERQIELTYNALMKKQWLV